MHNYKTVFEDEHEDTYIVTMTERCDSDSSKEEEDPPRIVQFLQNRFQNLPIHHLCHCFHQLHPDSLDENNISQLIQDVTVTTGQSGAGGDGKATNSTQTSTDCFGMTPLHVLACSARPNPNLLKVLLDRSSNGNNSHDDYDYSVLTKDGCGKYPIHHAVRCNAPIEIIELFIEAQFSYQPNSKDRRQEPPSFWKGLLDLACYNLASARVIKLLIESSMKDGIDGLRCPAWKEDVQSMILQYQHEEEDENAEMTNALENEYQPQPKKKPRISRESAQQLIKAVEKRLELYKFQETLSLLELAVWKAKLSSDSDSDNGREEEQEEENQRNRENCRIHCGAEFVTMHVLEGLRG
ncbi:MAG: hypothetical protein SGBAC_008498 [Bacillariaceae sp.]